MNEEAREIEEKFITELEGVVNRFLAASLCKPISDRAWSLTQSLKYFCGEWRNANGR
jgi:hypothetical protein